MVCLMYKENCQKIKLLKLIEMLRQESDPEHPLKTVEICKNLTKMGITCDRKTLSKDITVLRDFGYEIRSKMIGHEKGYYVENRGFSVAELKIMIDAIQAATFVTKEKSDDLINRIAAMGGTRREDILKSNIFCFNTRKHTNEGIYDNIEVLEEAIQRKRKASFFYFDRDEKGKRIYRKEKKRYEVEPMALVFNEDNYYLMCFSFKYNGITNYRVDCMENVVVENSFVSDNARIEDADIAKYTEQAFKMFGGPITDVTLEFEDKLIGVVQDKFGENTNIIRTGEDKCAASIQVQVSPTFWGWLFQFGSNMNILSPTFLRDKYREKIAEVTQ